MKSIAASEAARSFMMILQTAEGGEDVVITRAGKPIAKLVKMAGTENQTKPDEVNRARMRSIGWRDHP